VLRCLSRRAHGEDEEEEEDEEKEEEEEEGSKKHKAKSHGTSGMNPSHPFSYLHISTYQVSANALPSLSQLTAVVLGLRQEILLDVGPEGGHAGRTERSKLALEGSNAGRPEARKAGPARNLDLR